MMLADCVRSRIEDPLPALRTPEVCHASECTTGTYSRPKRPSELPRVKLDRPARRGPLGMRPLEEARAVVERDRLVLLIEHDPEAKEDPMSPMALRRSLGGLLGQATEPKRHKVEAEDLLRSGVVCEVYVIDPRHRSGERSLCSRSPHDRCDQLAPYRIDIRGSHAHRTRVSHCSNLDTLTAASAAMLAARRGSIAGATRMPFE